ncbi:MAG: T9SS type A sorting domain-containing protein [Paludibacter sp.]|nr:T9SS type A sorting domain-containing protein [Paludibacter sp.]
MRNLYLIFALCSFTAIINAQWQQRNSFQLSYIDNISVVDSNIVWVGDQTDQSLSVSKDGGQTWVRNNYQIGSFAQGAFTLGTFSAVNDSTAYIIAAGLDAAGTANNGVFKTTNGGKNWSKLPGAFSATSFPNFVYFWNASEGVAIGDAYPNNYFEIYTTSNGGQTWNQVQAANQASGNAEWGLNSSIHLRVVNGTIYFTTSGGRLFKSSDKGKNWAAINTPASSNTYMSFDFKNDNEGIVVFSNTSAGEKFVYTTSNGGATWTPQTGGEYWFLRQIKYDASRNIYFSTSTYGLAWSSDNGATWTQHPSFNNLSLGALQILPNNKVLTGGWGGIYYSTNYTGINPTVASASSSDKNKINIYFSDNINETSAAVPSKYIVTYAYNKGTANIADTIPVSSAVVDAVEKNKIVLTTAVDLPYDTITVRTSEIVSSEGLPVLFPGAGSRAQFIKMADTGLQDVASSGIKIYPNPAKDKVYIDSNGNIAGVKIVSVTGQTISEYNKLNHNTGSTISLPLNMKTGVYYLQFTDRSGQVIETKKLVKKE